MYTDHSHRPPATPSGAPATVFALMRIMIAAYFLASGTAVYLDPTVATPLDGHLKPDDARTFATLYLLATGAAVMFGIFVRPAALLLSAYVFWSGYQALGLSRSMEDLTGFWGQMALIGALLLVASAQPGGSDRFAPWLARIAPRRIPKAPAPKRAKRPTRTEPRLTRDAILTGEAVHPQSEEDRNLFSDIWAVEGPEPLVKGA